MLTLAIIVYFFMLWISNWNPLWPLKMLSGGLGDMAISIGWGILLFCGLS